MNRALPDTAYIFDSLFSDEQKTQIQTFLDGVKPEDEDKYSTDILWVIDKNIGGIGGYCMPSNPVKNVYIGLDRELFRPLQYARAEIEISDIRFSARHVVHYSGMHLEAVLRLFLHKTQFLGFRFSGTTLGKAAQKIAKTNPLCKITYDALLKFVPLYNRAKHEVNQDDDRLRLFSESDAIVCYFAARIIGQAILVKLNYSISLNKHPIAV